MNKQNHHYGNQFHLIEDTFLQTMLTELCLPKTTQPQINRLIEFLYNGLIIHTANQLFPKVTSTFKTRMNADLNVEHFSNSTKAVSVNLARAGTFPSHICYQFLHSILQAENIRQDHIFAARSTNSEEQVTGTQLNSHKIGGRVDDCFVLFPDPMGATGGTIISAIDYYEKQIPGKPQCFVALHLIVTPEYLKRILNQKQNVKVFALRVDRGLSPEHVIKAQPGLYWEQEKGLNEKQYIVPGAGGLGELLNNSFV